MTLKQLVILKILQFFCLISVFQTLKSKMLGFLWKNSLGECTVTCGCLCDIRRSRIVTLLVCDFQCVKNRLACEA